MLGSMLTNSVACPSPAVRAGVSRLAVANGSGEDFGG